MKYKLKLVGPDQQVVTDKEAVDKKNLNLAFSVPYGAIEDAFREAVAKALVKEMEVLASTVAEHFLTETEEGLAIIANAKQLADRYPAMSFSQLNEAVSGVALKLFQEEEEANL